MSKEQFVFPDLKENQGIIIAIVRGKKKDGGLYASLDYLVPDFCSSSSRVSKGYTTKKFYINLDSSDEEQQLVEIINETKEFSVGDVVDLVLGFNSYNKPDVVALRKVNQG